MFYFNVCFYKCSDEGINFWYQCFAEVKLNIIIKSDVFCLFRQNANFFFCFWLSSIHKNSDIASSFFLPLILPSKVHSGGENVVGDPKMRNNYGTIKLFLLSQYRTFLYCSCWVIALNLLFFCGIISLLLSNNALSSY